MPIVESVVEKQGKNGTFWIAVIDGKEVMAFNKEIFDLKGKELPYPIGTSQSGKAYVQFPKAGGKFGGGGGFQRGKSDREIYAQIFTMCMAYAKDKYAAELPLLDPEVARYPEDTDKRIVRTYRTFSEAILADLAKVVPVQPEAPKTETKAPEKPPQETSPPKAGTDTATLSAKDNLKAKMKAYLKGRNADTDNAFTALLTELTEFPGKDRDTGELTGKMVYIDDIDDKKFSDKWALTSYGKLKKLIEEEERKGANDMDDSDVRY